MTINALAYLGIHSDKLEDWSAFATQLLGMQRVDQSRGVLSFRMDDRKQRLSVSNESGEVLAFRDGKSVQKMIWNFMRHV